MRWKSGFKLGVAGVAAALFVASCSSTSSTTSASGAPASSTNSSVAASDSATSSGAPTPGGVTPSSSSGTASSAAAAGSQEPATITFLTFQSPNLSAKFWQDQVAEIQKTYPNLKVQIQYTPGLDRQGYAKQLLATGNLPDVIWDVPLQDFVTAKALLPYQPEDLAKFDVPADTGAIDGQHYSLTLGAQVIPMIYYNKTAFQSLGLQVPKTWAELMEVSAKIKAAGKTPFMVGGSSDAWTSTMLLDGIVDTDVYAKNPNWMADRKAGKVKFTDPDFKDAVTKWQQLLTAGYINKNALSLNYSQMQAAFTGGEAVMFPMGSWAGTLKPKFDVGVFPLPTADGSTVLSQNFGQALYISAKTKAPAQARAFAVALATNNGPATAQLNSDSLLPVIKGFQTPSATAPLIKETAALYNSPNAKKVLPFGWEQGAAAEPSGFVDAFNQAAQGVISGGSVDKFLADADRQFDDLNSK